MGEQDCWTPARIELLAWLRRNAPSLAELYDGSVQLIYVSPVPGRVRFISHAVREIRNRLPDVIAGSQEGIQLQYKNRLDELSELWVLGGLPTDGSLPTSIATGVSMNPGTPDIPVDRRLFSRIAKLIGDHNATRMKPEDAAIRLFAGAAPENLHSRDSLRPVVREWLDITDWFMGKAHDSGQVDADCDSTELRRNFEFFETILAALVRGFFTTAEELDAILEDANS